MKKLNLKIEIVCSTEPGLSSMSEASRTSVLEVLLRYYESARISVVNSIDDLDAVVARRPDLVFLTMKFLPVNPELGFQDPAKIWVADYLNQHGILFTGSDQYAHSLDLDKSLAKRRVQSKGLKTSPFYVVAQNQPPKTHNALTFPLFIKPTDRGGGMGIDSYSVAHNMDALNSKVESITSTLQSDSLVEEYLPGREFSVAILKHATGTGYSVMPLELIAPVDKTGASYLSAAIKTADTETFHPVTDVVLKGKLNTLALDVFHALGARDYGRIDIRLDGSNTPQFLEANLIPSILKDYGNFPKACKLNIDMDYETMILSIVNLAFKRRAIYPPRI